MICCKTAKEKREIMVPTRWRPYFVCHTNGLFRVLILNISKGRPYGVQNRALGQFVSLADDWTTLTARIIKNNIIEKYIVKKSLKLKF